MLLHTILSRVSHALQSAALQSGSAVQYLCSRLNISDFEAQPSQRRNAIMLHASALSCYAHNASIQVVELRFS